MKFAKYLQKTETPEWKKAYIDYRGIKKLIKAIEISRKLGLDLNSSLVKPRPSEVDLHSGEHPLEKYGSRFELPPLNFPAIDLFPEYPRKRGQHRISEMPHADSRRSSGLKTFASCLLESDNKQPFRNPLVELPLCETFTQLMPKELAFFAMLETQLEKVESFYLFQEKEMTARGFLLLNQLEELKDHRKMFLEAHTKKTWAATLFSTWSSRLLSQRNQPEQNQGQTFKMVLPTLRDSGEQVTIYSQDSHSSLAKDQRSFVFDSPGRGYNYPRLVSPADLNMQKQRYREEDDRTSKIISSNDPDSYIRAKRKLKKAVLEHYRGLEALYNYRSLNVTGFRKAVKKFQKKTKIPVQSQYMIEKVEICAFASGESVRNMLREMEELYAAAFVRGDKKKALKRLRARSSLNTHHFSTSRSGLLIGLAIPAFVGGLMKAFEPETQEAIPCWDILLFLYGLIFVPVLYSLLVGANLLIWARSRINYIFIFDLDVSSRIDYRQYFEIPSLLIVTLCYVFWVSFSQIGISIVQPTTWPLVWLVFAVLFMFNPMPVMAKSSRYWTIKTALMLFLSGVRRVEFADFWMGDQFCSFVFTLSNARLFVCVYLDEFSAEWQKCKNSSRTWAYAFLLASIPFIIRLVQSIRRYVDSRLITHLINAGKYGTGILAYLFYFMWSHHEPEGSRGTVFALWCVFNACYSIYACTWDFLVDFSVLQPRSKHLFLRTDLLYTHSQWVYYFSMFSNLLIRFIWVIYIPERGPNMMLRTFITGLLEMVRRVQWNFYRLENEHIGNMDQYRVTREMPLPYAFDFEISEEGDDDQDDSTSSG